MPLIHKAQRPCLAHGLGEEGRGSPLVVIVTKGLGGGLPSIFAALSLHSRSMHPAVRTAFQR